MRFKVLHRTNYRYEKPPVYSVQLLRLTARQDESQLVRHWAVTGDGALNTWSDAFGNTCHILVNRSCPDSIEITAEGEVVTQDVLGVLHSFGDNVPQELFLCQTARTRPDAAIRAFAEAFRPLVKQDPLDAMHRLMVAIREQIKYESGATNVHSSGADAFAAGRGVCQDHAHVFLGCVRYLGLPGRYVSGYLYNGEQERPYPAGHAWASVWVDDLGWVGFDVSNGISPYEHHVSIATGLDYESAGPVRGMRRGEAVGETMNVELTIQAVS